jgi:hypothetical protein
VKYRVSQDDRFSQVATRYGLRPAELLAMNPDVPVGRTLSGAPCVRQDAWRDGLLLEVGLGAPGTLGGSGDYFSVRLAISKVSPGGLLVTTPKKLWYMRAVGPGVFQAAHWTPGQPLPTASDWRPAEIVLDTSPGGTPGKNASEVPHLLVKDDQYSDLSDKGVVQLWGQRGYFSSARQGKTAHTLAGPVPPPGDAPGAMIVGTKGAYCPPDAKWSPKSQHCAMDDGKLVAALCAPPHAWDQKTTTCVTPTATQAEIPGTHGAFCPVGAAYDKTTKQCSNPLYASSTDPSCPPAERWAPQSGMCTETAKKPAAEKPFEETPQGPQKPTQNPKKPIFQQAPSPDPVVAWPTPGLTAPPDPAGCSIDNRIKGPGAQALYDPKTRMCVWPTGSSVIPNCPGAGLFNKTTETCGPPKEGSAETKPSNVPVIVAGVAVAGVALGLFFATVSGSAAKNRK